LKILLATDGSSYALKAAEYIAPMAKCLKADLTLAYVAFAPVGPMAFPVGLPPATSYYSPMEVEEVTKEAAEMALGKTRKVLTDHGLKAEEVVRESSSVADTIAEIAKEGGFDLIVVGNRGLGELSSMVLGSVSEHLVHHAPCPVLVVR